MRTQFDKGDRPLPDTKDPVEFGAAASQELERLNRPETAELLSTKGGGVLFSAPGANQKDREAAAVSFAYDRLNGKSFPHDGTNDEGADVSDKKSWNYSFLKDNLEPIFSDPKIEAQIQDKYAKAKNLSQQIKTLQEQADENPTTEQQEKLKKLQEERSKLYDDMDALNKQQDKIVDERIAATAAQDGDSKILSASELAAYILTVDRDKDGLLENDEERFTPTKNQTGGNVIS